MTKKLFKLNKKLGQGLKTLISVEKKSYSELVTQELTKNFIVLHFGLGIEQDYDSIQKFLCDIGEMEGEFQIDIYPGYSYGFLEFSSLGDSEKLVAKLHSLYQEEDFKVQENFKNLEKLKLHDSELFKRTVLLDFEGKQRNVFFFSTNLSKDDIVCGNQKENSLQSASRDCKQYEKIGLYLFENIITEEEEQEIFDQFKENPWENLSHRRV